MATGSQKRTQANFDENGNRFKENLDKYLRKWQQVQRKELRQILTKMATGSKKKTQANFNENGNRFKENLDKF